jgi:hypothetical protein
MARVWLHVAWLPAWSVAVQIMTLALLAKSEETETVPSALTVQPLQPVGHAHVTVALVHESEAVAETVIGPELQTAEASDIEHETTGGVVSTTLS